MGAKSSSVRGENDRGASNESWLVCCVSDSLREAETLAVGVTVGASLFSVIPDDWSCARRRSL
jgi:hypothetical protein